MTRFGLHGCDAWLLQTLANTHVFQTCLWLEYSVNIILFAGKGASACNIVDSTFLVLQSLHALVNAAYAAAYMHLGCSSGGIVKPSSRGTGCMSDTKHVSLASRNDEVIQMRQVCSQDGSRANLIESHSSTGIFQTYATLTIVHEWSAVCLMMKMELSGLHAFTSVGRL